MFGVLFGETMNKLGDPNNLQTRQEALNEAIDEISLSADGLYYAASLLTFCSRGSANKIAGMADQLLMELKQLTLKN